MKDTTNLESYNIWTGTDYNQNTEGFTEGTGITLSPSKTWSKNGENSLLIIKNSSTNYFIDTTRLRNLNVGDTITYKCTIYNTSNNGSIVIRGAGTHLTSLSIPSSEKPMEIMLYAIIPEDYGYICLRFLPAEENIGFYVDDISSIVS